MEIEKVDILAIGVHPDDVELSCMGTVLKHIDLGYSVGLCDLTQGELGTRGTKELRLKEAEDSRQFVGAKFRINLGLPDGFIRNDKETILSIAKVLRLSRPHIVFANALDDRHPDHGRASKIVSDACFYSGLSKVNVRDDEGNDLKAHRPYAVYHYIQDRNMKPDFVVDISKYIDQKFESILKFRSQFYDPEAKEPSTPISGIDFIEFLKAKNKSMARDIGVAYAEGFNIERTIGVDDVMKLK